MTIDCVGQTNLNGRKQTSASAIFRFICKTNVIQMYISARRLFISAVTFRVDETLKAAAVEKLSAQGISLSDALRDTFAYIAEMGRSPVKRRLVTDEDAELIEIVRERLKNPAQKHRMTFAKLKNRHRE